MKNNQSLSPPQTNKTDEFYESQFQRIWRRFLSHKLAVIGGCVVIILLFSAIFAGLIASRNPLD